MDTDPNWTLDEGWAWGDPNGNGSWNGDPNTGHTGDNVLGYALDGDYADNLGRDALRHDRPDRLHGLQEHPPELLALARRRVARTTTPASRSPTTA